MPDEPAIERYEPKPAAKDFGSQPVQPDPPDGLEESKAFNPPRRPGRPPKKRS